jgi:hypothetical protein
VDADLDGVAEIDDVLVDGSPQGVCKDLQAAPLV